MRRYLCIAPTTTKAFQFILIKLTRKWKELTAEEMNGNVCISTKEWCNDQNLIILSSGNSFSIFSSCHEHLSLPGPFTVIKVIPFSVFQEAMKRIKKVHPYMGVRRYFSSGRQSRHFAYLLQFAGEASAMKMDVHKKCPILWQQLHAMFSL